ncbi:hypothetical protein LZD49_10055 [Dyadobacter sp. CY261]|uniref:hypothetical protein n=1 Tax=Dyadobacter sp. CY261 TaxID=2907203 RepID=UPI001F47048B|nr:hypothetical protein [Dyadobacter sp. CY261]MCF0070815.1 hypothetical protein [Dyadobacter sp. CY261]
MKNLIKTVAALFIAVAFWQCEDSVTPKERETSGEWSVAEGTGGGNRQSPKNRYYNFKVSGNGTVVTINLTATVDAGFYLFDHLGQQVAYSYTGRDQKTEMELKEDDYTVMVFSEQRDAIGSYTLNVDGTSTDLTRISHERLKIDKVSFGADGGGGNRKTFRNHFYQFETTEDNAIVDVSLDISGNDGFVTLYNQLGEVAAYSYTGRSQFVVENLPKGKHTILVGTDQRDVLNSLYELNVFGKVQNLARVSSQGLTLKDKWDGAMQNFTLNVTEDNSILDVALKSPDHNGSFTVHDPVGNQIAYSYSGRDQFTVDAVNKGTYTIKTYPDQGSMKGNYSLIVYGQFSDFKRQ